MIEINVENLHVMETFIVLLNMKIRHLSANGMSDQRDTMLAMCLSKAQTVHWSLQTTQLASTVRDVLLNSLFSY